MPKVKQPVGIRLAKFTQRRGNDECWHFTGADNGNGYGQLSGHDGKNGYAHRHAYEEAYGPIPEGMTVDHLCHTSECIEGQTCPHRRCVNPDHLSLAARIDNYLRSAREREWCQARNHRYADVGFIKIRGTRYCRGCYQEKQARAAERRESRRRPGTVPEDVKAAVTLAVRNGNSQADVGRRYGLSSQTVSRIISGRPREGTRAVQVTPAVRLQIKARDGYACARCGHGAGDGEPLNVHHRTPRGMGGSRDAGSAALSNLLTLCGTGTTGCHGWIESHREEAVREGWIVPHGIVRPADVPVRINGYWWMLSDTGTKSLIL